MYCTTLYQCISKTQGCKYLPYVCSNVFCRLGHPVCDLCLYLYIIFSLQCTATSKIRRSNGTMRTPSYALDDCHHCGQTSVYLYARPYDCSDFGQTTVYTNVHVGHSPSSKVGFLLTFVLPCQSRPRLSFSFYVVCYIHRSGYLYHPDVLIYRYEILRPVLSLAFGALSIPSET